MVDIVVTGRRVDVPVRVRTHALEKLAKVDKLCVKAIQVDVEFSRERNPRMSEVCERVELTCVSRGPAIRAEAAADDMLTAFDLAWTKLESRLRRSADRRRVHRGSRAPVSVAAATAAIEAVGTAGAEPDEAAGPHAGIDYPEGDGPMLVREKLHRAEPMNLDQALYEMELVGHDFFLFCDKDSGLPSVVYRRRAYDYGVIRIDTRTSAATDPVGDAISGADGGAISGADGGAAPAAGAAG